MNTALHFAQKVSDSSTTYMNVMIDALQAYHLNPQDKAVLYNIAMIQQKAAEMLMAIAPSKRSLKELELGIQQATNAQKYVMLRYCPEVITHTFSIRLFASLAADDSPVVPYSKEMADQRRKYGDSMLRRCDEHLATQRQHEAEQHAKLEAARQRRQQEREQHEAAEVNCSSLLRRSN